jgi:uncharacterized protein YbaA (DUF1428 family)
MKHSKSHGGAGGGSAGLSGLLSNYDAYQRWVRAAHERVQFMKGALAMVDILADDSDTKKHRDLRRAEIESSQANVVFTQLKRVNKKSTCTFALHLFVSFSFFFLLKHTK